MEKNSGDEVKQREKSDRNGSKEKEEKRSRLKRKMSERMKKMSCRR